MSEYGLKIKKFVENGNLQIGLCQTRVSWLILTYFISDWWQEVVNDLKNRLMQIYSHLISFFDRNFWPINLQLKNWKLDDCRL